MLESLEIGPQPGIVVDAGTFVIDANMIDRVFDLLGPAGGRYTLRNLTITGGLVGFSINGGGLLVEPTASSTTRLIDCTVTENTAGGDGAGLYAIAPVLISGSTFSLNHSDQLASFENVSFAGNWAARGRGPRRRRPRSSP